MTMKKILLALTLIITGITRSQTFSLVSMSYPTCFGNCDGVAVFVPTTAVTGPFTAIISNTSSCVNSTVQGSSVNSITISALCECAGTYSINFFDVNSILCGYELLQVPITATSALVLQTPTVDPAVCATCCEGSVYVTYSGGYAPPPNNATVTLDGVPVVDGFYPIDSVCVGQHTVCVKDLANCIACNSFSMNFVPHVSVKESGSGTTFHLSPNPANDRLLVQTITKEQFSEIKLIDLSGKVAILKSNSPANAAQKEFDLSGVPEGVYIVEIGTLGSLYRQKLVKVK